MFGSIARVHLMIDDPSRTKAIQNASVLQLTSLLTDPVLTAIPHQKTFLELVNHKDAWVTPMTSIHGQVKDGLASALSAVTTGGADPQKALDDLASQIQAKLDANEP
jgi:maltose-binding protein MalE